MLGAYLCFIGLYSPYYVILIGRFFLGLSLIIGVGLGSLFITEISPLEYRGVTGAFVQIFRSFGAFLAPFLTLPELLGTPDLWTAALAVPAFPAIVDFLFLLCVQESPRYLFISQDKPQEAAEAVEFYQGMDRVDSTLEELRAEKDYIESRVELTFRDKFLNSTFLKPLILATLALSNRNFAGGVILESYSTNIFQNIGFNLETAAYATVVLGACQLLSALSVSLTVEQCGRRNMLIGSNMGCLLSMIGISIGARYSQTYESAAGVVLISGVVYMLLYPILGSVGNIVASEVCNQEIRSTAFTVGLLCYSTVGLLSTYLYPWLKHSYGFEFTFIPFIIILFITIIVYLIWLPETSGIAFHDIRFDGEQEGQARSEKKQNQEQTDIEEIDKDE